MRAPEETPVNADKACNVPILRYSSLIPLYTMFSITIKQAVLICWN